MKPRPLLGPRDIRRLLDVHHLAPRRTLGQSFVVDANTVRKVVRDAEVGPGDLVCEIGPGLGSLTLALREAGAVVVAVEVDAGLVRALRDVLVDDPGVRVVHADAMSVDFSRLLAGSQPHAAPTRTPVLVANLPYNLATPLLLRALHSGAFSRLLVMVQREIGQRWVARVGDPLYGAVSVKLAALASARIVAPVSRSAFHPVPRVDSVTVRVVPRADGAGVDRRRLFALVDAGFRHRRKRLRNALSAPDRPPPAVEQALVAVGLDAGARAEELSLPQWEALSGRLG